MKFNRFLSRSFVISFCCSLLIWNFSLLISKFKAPLMKDLKSAGKIKLSDLQDTNNLLQGFGGDLATITQADSPHGNYEKANKLLLRAHKLIQHVSESSDLSLSDKLNILARAQRLSEEAKSLVPFSASVRRINNLIIKKKLDIQNQALKSFAQSSKSSSFPNTQRSDTTQPASSAVTNIAPNMAMNFDEPIFISF